MNLSLTVRDFFVGWFHPYSSKQLHVVLSEGARKGLRHELRILGYI